MKINFSIGLCILLALLFVACTSDRKERENMPAVIASDSASLSLAGHEINAMLDAFNLAAANAEYDTYFNFFTDHAVFIGTDASENWNKSEYMEWAKPYFDKKETWNFKSLERHVFFDKTGTLAWFDELLDTQMKICRGSGVLIKENEKWKIQQYVLSMTIPNSEIDSVLKFKSKVEDPLLQKLRSK